MPSTCPVKHAAPAEKDSTSSESAGGNNACPYRHDKGQRPTTSMPANSELPPNQRPTPGQRKLLSTERVQSTIPRSEGDDTWQYPSQQMFYNAMKRKGYAPSEDDMDSVVAIHNAVNERTWQEILKWEKAHCEECPTPKLLRFQGRPADLSPKARLMGYLGYELPFDRHDWVVDRCGEHVRYVIDFYSGAPDLEGGKPVSVHIDSRPALDSPGAFFDRVRRAIFGAPSDASAESEDKQADSR